MKRSGPDSLNSWLIAFACSFINMMMYGMARLSGILFVASISRFNVTREKASFPFTFDNFMRNTSGPLVGYLGHRFGVRAVTTFGCLLGAIGAGACYFAESITAVTILWGAIFGLGFGLGSILLPVSINQYFDKHRASASGIALSGACIGSFILPPVVELCLNNYGLSGTFLFLSGFILNCVPAALLLKKPDFDINGNSSDCDSGGSETQSIMAGVKVKLYTEEDELSKSYPGMKANTKIDIVPKFEALKGIHSQLTYEDKMKRLSTQTLLSDYSIRMSVSDPLDVEKIIENNKGRRMVDPKVLESDSLSLISHNSDEDGNSPKDSLFENETRSASFLYEKEITPIKTRAFSCNEITFCEGKNETGAHLNQGYQDEDEVEDDSGLDMRTNDNSNSNMSSKTNHNAFYANSSTVKNSTMKNEIKKYSNGFIKFSDDPQKDNFKLGHDIIIAPPGMGRPVEKSKKSALESFSIIFDPMFVLIAVTNALYCFTFVCMITIIVDFARDLDVGASNEKYVLMFLSVGDLIGRLCLGWITDRGYLTTTEFAALCFASQGISTAAIVWSNGFTVLIILVSIYGLSEAGIIVIYPVIISQYIDHDKQTVAIPSSNFLSGPLCLTVAPLIGYFRDEIGAYDYIFYGIAILSAICSAALLVAPYVAKLKKRPKCETT